MDKITITALRKIEVELKKIDSTIGDFIWDHDVEFVNSKIVDDKIILYVFEMADNTATNMLKGKGLRELLKEIDIDVVKTTIQKEIAEDEATQAACPDNI